MSLFLPITTQSQSESEKLSLPSKNPFYDKDGSPIYEFSLEFIYGLYYTTNPDHGDEIESFNPTSYLCDYKIVDGKKVTYGSTLIHKLFNDHGFSMNYKLGDQLTSKSIKSITSTLFKDYTDSITDILKLLGELTELSTKGFSESGLSIKFNDFIRVDKSKLNSTTKIIDFIMEEDKLIEELESNASPDNSFLSMMKSGTKGNYSQLKQVMVSKGVLIDNEGNYLTPIRNSLAEGLTFDEFITTISASRRGLVSKSLSTAKTGFFYYRLVKSMRDLVVVEDDCGTDKGYELKLVDSEGRFLNKSLGKYTKGTLITKSVLDESILFNGEDHLVEVRSPIYCNSEGGVCKKCYGLDISKNSVVKLNDNIGVTTGSTLSEIMSQAMLRNFHTSGATDIDRVVIKSPGDIDNLNIESLGDRVKITVMDKIYLIKSDIISIIKTNNIKKGDEIFMYNLGNSDINTQFYRLESILEARSPKNPSIAAPIDGLLEFDSIIDEVQYFMDKKLKIEIPRKVQFINITITNSDTKIDLKIPFDKTFTIPFNSEIKKGTILTDGLINYKSISKYMNYDQVVDSIMKDLNEIFLSQGSKVRSIHFELILRHLIDRVDNSYSILGITNKGLSRSFIQHMSLGWYKKALPDILDDLKVIGEVNADKIVLGTYE